MCDYYPEDATPTYLSILKYGKPTRTRRLEESSSTSGSGSESDRDSESDSDSENWSIGMDMDINININNDMSNEEKLLYNHERGQASTSGSTSRKLPYISPGSSSCFATFGGTSHTYFTPTFATLFIIVIGTITTMQLYLQ